MVFNPIFDLSGHTALVTGASSGFGRHFSQILAAHGAKVVVCARRQAQLAQLVTLIEEAGGEACAVTMDVTCARSVRAAFDQAQKHYGCVDIVSNNAGVADSKLALNTDEQSWDFVLDTNLKGAWQVASEAGRRMVEAGLPGSIVNTASILGLRVAPGQLSYATSKAALIHMTRSLALEWTRHRIRVNALCPGYFETEINAAFFATQKGQKYIHASLAGRCGEMSEISAAFLLLASNAGSFINGVALPVDGGHSIANF